MQGFNSVLRYMGKHPNKGPEVAKGLFVMFNAFGPGKDGYNAAFGFDSILDTITKDADNSR